MIGKKLMILGGLLALSTFFALTFTLAGSLVMSPVSVAIASETGNFAAMEDERGFPVRGMSSSAVIEQYGEPGSRTTAVGDPPISMWQYEAFNVYFEYKLVITTVATEDLLPEKLKEIQ
jgi:hypothetical protein